MSRSLTGVTVFLLVVAAMAPAAIVPAAADDVTLTVTVTAWSGETVEDAELTATWDGGSTTDTTRANGKALLDVPDGADVTIRVDHDRYIRNHPHTVDNAQTTNVDIRVAERGEATIAVTGGGGPVENARVRFILDGRTATTVQTDSQGVARSGPIEQDTYVVAISKPGYLKERITVGVREETERSASIRRANVQAAFTVHDNHFEDPEPIENATIAIEPIGVSLVTLSNGEATTVLPVNRDYEVTVSKPGYVPVTRSFGTGEADASMTAEISRTPEVTATAANRRVVVGETTSVTVIDEYDDPIEGASLTVDGAEVATTDADGEADVTIESAGNVTIRAGHNGNEDTVTVEGVQPGNGGTETTETEGGIGPGFGAIVALLAMGLAAGLLARRR